MFTKVDDSGPQSKYWGFLPLNHWIQLFKKEMETFVLFSEVSARDFSLLKRILLTFECNSGYLMGWLFGFPIIGVQPKTISIDKNLLYFGSYGCVILHSHKNRFLRSNLQGVPRHSFRVEMFCYYQILAPLHSFLISLILGYIDPYKV